MAPKRGTSLAVMALVLAPALGDAQPERHAHGEDTYLSGPNVDVTRDLPGDLVAMGGTVRVAAPVAESAILAGGNVTVEGEVGDSVIAAGGDVTLRGRVGDDARIAGGTVRIAGRVEDDATLAGGTVRVERDGFVGGRAFLAGGELVVAGTVGKQLRAAGRRVTIEGTVHGDVHVDAESLDIGPAARIDGDLIHRGPREPRIATGARIGGRVEHGPRAEAHRAPVFAEFIRLVFLAGLFVMGALMIVAFPRFTPAAAQTIRTDPWLSLGIGALALAAAPAVMVALLFTGVGVPLALVLLAAYLVALLAGYLVAALFVGMAGMSRLASRPSPSRGTLVLALLAALVILRIVRLLPVLGALVSLATLLFGLGALLTELYRTYRASGEVKEALPGGERR